MRRQGSGKKALIVGIVAAVVILVALLALLLTQCNGILGSGQLSNDGSSVQTTAPEKEKVDIYWNLDREDFEGKSEAGLSSRVPAEDGYFHIRFQKDGEVLVLKTASRQVVNRIDSLSLMGLVFDAEGYITGVIHIDEMPVQKLGWLFYVQSTGGKLIKLNSSMNMVGMEVLLETGDKFVGCWDMTGLSGERGCAAEPGYMDRVYAIGNEDGELTHLFLFDRSEYMLSHEGHCEHCDTSVTWYEWRKTTSLPLNTGHYQLTENIALSGQMSMPSDAKICLDLNGKTVDGKEGARMYSLHNRGCELAIMDTSEEKTGRLAAHGLGDQGLCVWVRYGAFYLYDGILDASDASTNKNGTTVQVPKGAFFYMNGGELIGGTSTYGYNETTGKYTYGLGGTMSVLGKFVMNDGIIRDGYAKSAKYYDKGVLTWARGMGGNIFLGSGSVMEMNGGVIKNGKSDNIGGNIMMDGNAELTINGGKIQGGKVTGKGKNGGNLWIPSKATVLMNGGVISGGSTYNSAGNVYLNGTFTMNGGVITGGKVRDYETRKIRADHTSRNVYVVNGKFYMYGGTIYGSVAATDSSVNKKYATVLLSGYATIAGGPKNTPNLTIFNPTEKVQVRVGNMLGGSKVGVTTAMGIFSKPTKQGNVDNFFSDLEGAQIHYVDGCLALGKTGCICGLNSEILEEHINGCDGVQRFWSPWTTNNSLPTTTGNYYLTTDVVTTNQKTIFKDNQVVLDLGGHNVTYQVPTYRTDGFRLYRADDGAKLAITDTTGMPGTLKTVMPAADAEYTGTALKKDETPYTTEEVRKLWQTGNSGMLLWARGGEITIHNGIFDGSNLTGAKDGLVFYICNNTADGVTYNGSITMYAGEVKNGTTSLSGNIRVNGTGSSLNIHGGTISGGKAYTGGNISVNGLFTMTGGTVSGGEVEFKGGNIFIHNGEAAEATMTGGLVIGGRSVSGGNISLDQDVTFTVSGGTISGGEVVYNSENKGGGGGNITVNNDTTKLVVSGGEITGGKAAGLGGNIYLNASSASAEITGGSVSGGSAANGGNIGQLSAGNVLTITGGTVSGGTASDKGGNLCIVGALTISDGTVSGGTAKTGGSIYTGGKNTLSGGTVEKGEAVSGGNIALNGKTAELTLSGTKVAGGNATGSSGERGGGNIYVGNDGCKTFTISAGSVENGTSARKGGNIFVDCTQADSFQLNMTGGTVTGGTALGGGNINLTNGVVMNLSGGEVTEGTATGSGGNITVNNQNAKLVMTGGAVSGGEASTIGGNIYMNASGARVELLGGTMTGGTAKNGGNVGQFHSKNVLIVDGATISGGTAEQGKDLNIVGSAEIKSGTVQGNSFVSGTMTISGGTVEAGESDNGGCIFVAQKGKLVMSGGTVRNGKAENGGCVFVDSDGSMTLSGGTITGGNATTSGGAIAIEQGGKLTMTGGTVSGSTATADGGSICLKGSAELSGGTITGGTAKNGGNLAVTSANAELKLSGVTIEKGTATAGVEEGKTSTGTEGGGNIYVTGAKTMTMAGDTVVTGGITRGRGGNLYLNAGNDLNFQLSGGEISSGNGYVSGNINLAGKTDMTMSGGTVKDGVSGVGGGNITINNTDNKLTVSGGTISGGQAPNGTGGNIYLNANSASVEISGGNITGGTAKTGNNIGQLTTSNQLTVTGGTISGGGVYVTGKFTVSGGTISGGVTVKNTSAAVKLSGNPVIYGAAKNLDLNGAVVTLTANLEEGAKIGVSNNAAGVFAKGASGVTLTLADKAAFYSDSDAYQIIKPDSDLHLADASKHYACICGGTLSGKEDHTCVDVEFTKADFSKPITGNVRWYLDGPVTLSSEFTTSDAAKVGYTLNLDLNGQTLTMNGGRLTANGTTGVLTISDSKGGGQIVAAQGAQCAFVYTYKGNAVMYGGTLNAKDAAAGNGGAVYINQAGDSFTMHGGTIIGSKNGTTAGSVYVRRGTFTLHDGIIRDGVASAQGGNVFVHKDAVMFMHGGTIENGVAAKEGGNICFNNSLTMTGGTVTGGSAGGNGGGGIYVGYNCAGLKLSGSAVISGNASEDAMLAATASSVIILGPWDGNGSLAAFKLAKVSGTAGTVAVQPAEGYTLTEADVAKFAGVELKDGKLVLVQ